MIAKKDLENLAYYAGTSRNAEVAVWHADRQVFVHIRFKFGRVFLDNTNHPEDDNNYDTFAPERKIYPSEVKDD